MGIGCIREGPTIRTNLKSILLACGVRLGLFTCAAEAREGASGVAKPAVATPDAGADTAILSKAVSDVGSNGPEIAEQSWDESWAELCAVATIGWRRSSSPAQRKPDGMSL